MGMKLGDDFGDKRRLQISDDDFDVLEEFLHGECASPELLQCLIAQLQFGDIAAFPVFVLCQSKQIIRIRHLSEEKKELVQMMQ